MTLGGMLKHLTWVESWWFRRCCSGSELEWVGDGFTADPDWEWTSAKDDTWELLVSRHREVVAECDAILDAALATPEGLDLLAKSRATGSTPPCAGSWST